MDQGHVLSLSKLYLLRGSIIFSKNMSFKVPATIVQPFGAAIWFLKRKCGVGGGYQRQLRYLRSLSHLGCLLSLIYFHKGCPVYLLFALPAPSPSASSPYHFWSSGASSPLCSCQMAAYTHLLLSRMAQKGACHRPVKQVLLRLGPQTQYF